MIKEIKIKEATSKQLKEHYDKTVSLRLDFDKIRPDFYEVKYGSKDPMMEHYRQWLIKRGVLYIAIIAKDKKECIVCGGGHHYYNCPNDSIQDDGSININNSDMTILLELVSDKILNDKNNKYKLLHKKLLDIVCM